MNSVKLYYPSVTSNNKPIDQMISNKLYKQIIKDISEVSGGLTVIPCQGYYINANDQLINDDISLITVYTDKIDQMIELIKNESMLILKSLDQESVMIEINNQVEFITSQE